MAERSNAAKDQFIATISHELRTPLHGMLGLTDMARAPDIDDTLRRQYLDQISESDESAAPDELSSATPDEPAPPDPSVPVDVPPDVPEPSSSPSAPMT